MGTSQNHLRGFLQELYGLLSAPAKPPEIKPDVEDANKYDDPKQRLALISLGPPHSPTPPTSHPSSTAQPRDFELEPHSSTRTEY